MLQTHFCFGGVGGGFYVFVLPHPNKVTNLEPPFRI